MIRRRNWRGALAARVLLVGAILVATFGVQSPVQAVVAGENGLIVFVSGNTDRPGVGPNQLFVTDGSGSFIRNLTDLSTTFYEHEPAWSPDGTKIAYHRVSEPGGTLDIWVMDADGRNQRPLIATRFLDASPRWSPDGRKIAFSMWVDGQSELFIADSDGTSRTRLTRTTANEAHPEWTPDGRRVVFTRGGGIWRGSSIHSVRVDGTDEREIRPADGRTRIRPRVSPDGTTLVYESNESIYRSNLDGSGETRLTPTSSSQGSPTWSPDGFRILYSHRVASATTYEFFTMSPDGSNKVRLPGTAGVYAFHADWQALAPPSPPSRPLLKPIDGGVVLAWKPPVMSGATPVSEYRVHIRRRGSDTWKLAKRGLTATRARVDGLVNGRMYEFRIVAGNEQGLGRPGRVRSIRAGVATRPQAVAVSPDELSLDLSWSPPKTLGGSDLVRYHVAIRPAGGTWKLLATPDGDRQSLRVVELQGGVQYDVIVRAVTVNGKGAWSGVHSGTPL